MYFALASKEHRIVSGVRVPVHCVTVILPNVPGASRIKSRNKILEKNFKRFYMAAAGQFYLAAVRRFFHLEGRDGVNMVNTVAPIPPLREGALTEIFLEGGFAELFR